jgi:hypothetical protein
MVFLVTEQLDATPITARSCCRALEQLDGTTSIAFLDIEVLDGLSFGFARELAFRKIPFAFVSASSREWLPDDLKATPFIAKPPSDADIKSVGEGLLRLN